MDYPKLRAYLIQEIGEKRYREMLDRKTIDPKDKVPPIHFYEFFGGLSGSNRVDATPRQIDAYRILAFVGAYMTDREDSESKKMIKRLATQYANDWLSKGEAVGFLRAAGATSPKVKANGKAKSSAIAKTEAYRWDSILTIKELVKLLADGNPTIEKQVHDTLRHMASNDYYTMNTNHGSCRVILSKGLCFLKSKGHTLPEWTDSLKSGDGLKISTPPPVDEKTTKPPQYPVHIHYLANEINNWDAKTKGPVSAKKLEAHVLCQIENGKQEIPFQKHGAMALKKRGDDEGIKAFQNMFTKAKKLAKSS